VDAVVQEIGTFDIPDKAKEIAIALIKQEAVPRKRCF
jgi:hypothetical protein